MSVKLPRPPRMEMLFTTDAQGRVKINQGVLTDIRVYFEALSKIVAFDSGSIDWTAINFDNSRLQDITTRRHSDLQIIEQLDLNDTNTDKTKHLSNAQGKAWQLKSEKDEANGYAGLDENVRVVIAELPLADADGKLLIRRTGVMAYDTLVDADIPATAQRTSEKDVAGGYAGLNADSRTTKGVITTDDLIVNLATKGLVLKDTQGTPHYWRMTVDNTGTLITADLGTVAP